VSDLIVNWTSEKSLAETGLFTDEALIDMLDKHPSNYLDVCTMSNENHPKYPNRMMTGDFRDASSKEILEAAKAGNVWVNVREAMNIHPDYKKVLDEMYAELSELSGIILIKRRRFFGM